MRYSYLQVEKYIVDKITSLCEKRDISKYRLSQLSGVTGKDHGAGKPAVADHTWKNMCSFGRDIIAVFSGR